MNSLEFLVTGGLALACAFYLIFGIIPVAITSLIISHYVMDIRYVTQYNYTFKQALISKASVLACLFLWPVACPLLIILSIIWAILGYEKYHPYRIH